jgi:predicted nucleic acid-binding protein
VVSNGLRYLDSSAIVKLVLAERESGALARWLGDTRSVVSSEVALVEVVRAVRLADAHPATEEVARRRLEEMTLVVLSRELLERAASARPPRLRALDAIHLATALAVEPDELVAYDGRLLEAAAAAGLRVASPGA